MKGSGKQVDAIECKINPDRFEIDALAVFRASYPEGRNYVVSPAVKMPYQQRIGKLLVRYCNVNHLPWLEVPP